MTPKILSAGLLALSLAAASAAFASPRQAAGLVQSRPTVKTAAAGAHHHHRHHKPVKR